MSFPQKYRKLREKRRAVGDLRELPPIGRTYVPEKYRLVDLETGDIWEPRDGKWKRLLVSLHMATDLEGGNGE